MRSISPHHYVVSAGEHVRIAVSLVNTRSAAFAAILDGWRSLPLSPESDLAFAVTEPPGGAHLCEIDASFPADAPDDAAADFAVTGDGGSGGGRFSLRKRDTLQHAVLRFEVEGGQRASEAGAPREGEEADPPIIIGGDGITPPQPW